MAAPQRERTEREVIAYLAYMGILLAFGIDAALPAFDELRPAFGLEPESNRITLVVTWYFIGLAAGQVVYGPLSDRFGRIPALRLGIAIYCLGAIGSIVAPNIELLFASRLVWGLGAAAPGVLRAAIARDLYAGDQMARVMSIMMAVFLMGPILAPVAGEAILAVASWEWVFAASLVLAAVLAAWTARFGETLDPDQQRPLEPRAILRGFRVVFTTRSTFGYTMGLTFGFGGFIVYLGSSQPIIDVIYDRGDQFALWFGVAGGIMAIGFFSVNRFIDRYGAHAVAVFCAVTSVVASAVLLVEALRTDGVPSFWTWLALIVIANMFITLLTPTGYSLGLEPLGELAGTASAVMGLVSTAGGSALAAIVDSQIDDTITPMALGYVSYGLIAVAFLLWAGAATESVGTSSP